MSEPLAGGAGGGEGGSEGKKKNINDRPTPLTSVHPALHMSHFGPYLLPSTSSGGTNAGVPHLVDMDDSASDPGGSLSNRLAKPKSASLTPLASSSLAMRRRFSGLMSRWAIPLPFRNSTAPKSALAKSLAVFSVYVLRSARRSKTSPPRASSITMR